MSTQLFLQSLRDRRDRRDHALQHAGAILKYGLRSARNASLHMAWLDFVYGTSLMRAMLATDPRLIERMQHHYVNRRLKPPARYAIISDHYRKLMAIFPPAMLEAIYLGGGYPIGTLTLKDGSALAIELRRPSGRSREGELCLCLADTQGRLLSSMIFSIADGGSTIVIGCLQGAAAGLGLETVRELTKQSHGLRPKNLLLSLLRAFADYFGITRVRGIANVAHPYARHSDKIKANYDSFWLECEGVLDDQDFYEIPVSEPVRDEARVASKHRSTFRQREALRREACNLLRDSFDHNGVTHTPTLALAV